jgi:hypothetical protein
MIISRKSPDGRLWNALWNAGGTINLYARGRLKKTMKERITNEQDESQNHTETRTRLRYDTESAKGASMKTNFVEMVEELTATTLDGPGEVAAELRREVAAYTAVLKPGNKQIPAQLLPYLSKVAMHSYRVTDMDMAQLKAAGFSEDELYELTICAALGAGMARLDRGLELLKN